MNIPQRGTRPCLKFQFDSGEDGAAFKLEEMRSSAALLLGRITYELFARHWPSAQGQLAESRQLGPNGVLLVTYLPATHGEPTIEATDADPTGLTWQR